MSSIIRGRGGKLKMDKNSNSPADPRLPIRRTSNIRCVFDCVKALCENKPLPRSLCFVPKEEVYHCVPNAVLPIYDSPSKNGRKIIEWLSPKKSDTVKDTTTKFPCGIIVSGEECLNRDGKWLRIMSIRKDSVKMSNFEAVSAWILLYASDSPQSDVPLVKCGENTTGDDLKSVPMFCKDHKTANWMNKIEQAYSLNSLRNAELIHNEDVEGMTKLRVPPPNWSCDLDAELTRFIQEIAEPVNENYGSIKNLVENIQVSTTTDDGIDQLTDDDPDTYWESDGSQGDHWIRLTMKKGTIIRRMLLTLDGDDGNFIPYHIIIMAGEAPNQKKIQDMYIDLSFSDVQDICILEDINQHYPVIEIRIKECKDDGIDVRVHGIKIKSSQERDVGVHLDTFTPQALMRYPLLEGFNKESLFRRALVLQRFITLLDSVLPFLMPEWEFSTGTFKKLLLIRHLLPLSKKRSSLIDTLLKESETAQPDIIPKLFINRRSAAEHKSDPSLDPDCRNTVFMQIFEGLKPKDRHEKSLDYRWPTKYNQWWECKFLSEGIIDQGGGFRDSLSDISEELCPSSGDAPMPLPLFIRAPNLSSDNSAVNTDVYVPNPSYSDLAKYHWIGQLMGACFRGKESLVLFLPAYTWKQISGESVTWSRDYPSVDIAEVKLIERIENCDKDSFDAHFGDWLCWTTRRSDGAPISLKEDSEALVTFEERLEYCNEVKTIRMNESMEQVEAMRRGLLEVVPLAVIQLMTWQELEKKICGDPEVSVEALRKCTRFEDLDQSCSRMQYLWEALTNFTNDERSRYLRFVTGRRRLPTPIYVCPDRDQGLDALPESSTCSNTLFLPNYPTAAITEEKLRYAIYYCVAIDTDMSPWDEYL